MNHAASSPMSSYEVAYDVHLNQFNELFGHDPGIGDTPVDVCYQFHRNA